MRFFAVLALAAVALAQPADYSRDSFDMDCTPGWYACNMDDTLSVCDASGKKMVFAAICGTGCCISGNGASSSAYCTC